MRFMVRLSSPAVYSEGAMAFLGDKGEGRCGWLSCRHKTGVPGLGAGLGWACKLVTRQRDLSEQMFTEVETGLRIAAGRRVLPGRVDQPIAPRPFRPALAGAGLCDVSPSVCVPRT